MRKDRFKFQIGDVVYEPLKCSHKIREWKIIDIYVEDLIISSKTIFVIESNGGEKREVTAWGIRCYYDDYEMAMRCLK